MLSQVQTLGHTIVNYRACGAAWPATMERASVRRGMPRSENSMRSELLQAPLSTTPHVAPAPRPSRPAAVSARPRTRPVRRAGETIPGSHSICSGPPREMRPTPASDFWGLRSAVGSASSRLMRVACLRSRPASCAVIAELAFHGRGLAKLRSGITRNLL